MAYDDYENSVSDSEPVELFEFTQGSSIWRWTSANVPIEYDTYTWEPTYIERGEIEQAGDDVRNEMSVIVHYTNALAALFIPASPELATSFVLYRGHESTFIVYWIGSVLGVSFQGEDATIKIGPPLRGGATSGLRRKYQKQCTYPLYGSQCGVNKLSYLLSGVVNNINGTVLTINVANSKPDGWFTGGQFVSGQTKRMIMGHTGTSVTLSQGINLVDIGDSCTLYAGCGHGYTVCDTKFSNRINFGGQPWIPSRNPFGGDGVT